CFLLLSYFLIPISLSFSFLLFLFLIQLLPRSPPFPTRRSSDLARLTLTPGDVIEYPKSQAGAPAATGLDFFAADQAQPAGRHFRDRKSTRLNSSHVSNSYAVFCLKKNIK